MRDNLDLIQKYLGTTGRQKFINTVYKQLVVLDRLRAISVFNLYRNFYHPSARKAIAKILNLDN
jgi:hypothetical protein